MSYRCRSRFFLAPLLLGLTMVPVVLSYRQKMRVRAATLTLTAEIDDPLMPQLDVMRRCVAQGGNIRTRSWNGATLLHAAAWENTKTVVFLLDHGADINARDDGGATPLVEAIRAIQPDIVRLLLARGAKVNQYPGGSEINLAKEQIAQKRDYTFVGSAWSRWNARLRQLAWHNINLIIAMLKAAGAKE